MAQGRLTGWETLFLRARCVLDSVPFAFDWSFGGGTVLMRRHRHRVSKDIDIFIPDPQLLGHLSPRLNPAAEALTPDYLEQAKFVKLYFAEGEIDFVVAAALTRAPAAPETILGREVRVETSAEIIAKKVWYRAAEFKARDLFDLAIVAEREPEALRAAGKFLSGRRQALLRRLDEGEEALREDFEALEALDCRPSFDDCVHALLEALDLSTGRPPRVEQPYAEYVL